MAEPLNCPAPAATSGFRTLGYLIAGGGAVGALGGLMAGRAAVYGDALEHLNVLDDTAAMINEYLDQGNPVTIPQVRNAVQQLRATHDALPVQYPLVSDFASRVADDASWLQGAMNFYDPDIEAGKMQNFLKMEATMLANGNKNLERHLSEAQSSLQYTGWPLLGIGALLLACAAARLRRRA